MRIVFGLIWLIAVVETGIALALFLGVGKVAYIGGAVYSLMIWATVECLGRTSGVATDIGTAIIYAIVFLALLAFDARGRARGHTVWTRWWSAICPGGGT